MGNVRKRMRVYGIVQGVGFRPFVSHIAKSNEITGSVCNKGPYVEIFAEGTETEVANFRENLVDLAPERSSILKIDEEFLEASGDTEFKIIESEKERGEIFVSPDIATCPKCKRELFDPANRRYLHPFINCTACGPRLTILDSMPYDRVRTSMGEFPMCPECEAEYKSIADRRYHAQPVCCNDCGPELYILKADGSHDEEYKGLDAIAYTRDIIRKGGIAAIKGIGGFHLCCDAENDEVVKRLRTLKKRPFKPLAVMMKNIEIVRRECELLDGEEEIMDGPQKPIVLLRKKQLDDTRLSGSVAPDNPKVGVMLPYAPVQMLLFDYPDDKSFTDCLVMTSANPKGVPICKSDEDVLSSVMDLCDVVLSNNRKIRMRTDDTVTNWFRGEPYMIRRSRGYAPIPIMLSDEFGKGKKVLGIGGELKNTFCLGVNQLLYPSSYIGDLTDLRSVKTLESAVTRMENLLEIKPEVICTDMHPMYNSSAFGEELAAKANIRLLKIQHHYAHVLSCMAENNIREDVIGVSFDGTGYGTDGTVWGGEFLLASLKGFKRITHLESFDQAGGDLASKEGWRIALAILKESVGNEKAKVLCEKLSLCNAFEYGVLSNMIDKKINTVRSTSCGRLFDAAAAILGLRRKISCEGEAAMLLQFAAERYIDTGKAAEKEDVVGIGEFMYRLAKKKIAGEEVDKLALSFHEYLAEKVLAGVELCRKETGVNIVALTGGVMQNTLLLGLCIDKLEKNGFRVIRHKMISSNDGGIAVGQALYAMYN